MNKPPSELIALQTERAELMAKNAAATSWGAAVGDRSERIKEIDGLLAANQSGSERAGVDALREALDCLQSIADMEDDEPRQPDDADWRFRALECKRAAQCTIAALATPPAQPAPASGVQAWAAWHPIHGFGKLPNACADIDDAIEDAKCHTILDDSPDWKAVRVEIRRV